MGLSRRDKDAQRFRNGGRHYRKASLKEINASVRMVSFPLIRIQSSVTYPDMLPPHKVRLNKKSTTLRLTMIFKQPLNIQACRIVEEYRAVGR